MAQAHTQAAIHALSILARESLVNGQPLQAVKCLEAICRSSVQMPVAAAKTRLWLARVLSQHTQNLSEAAQHLQQALLLLKKVPATFCLKCEVLSELGRCRRYLAQHKLEMQAYQRGIELCVKGQQSSERDSLQQWQMLFEHRLMDVQVIQGNMHEAQQCLERTLQTAMHSNNSSTQAISQLSQLQLHMLSQDAAATSPALAACTELLVQMAQVPQPQPLFSQLQLHFCILRVLVLMKEGRYVELQKSGANDSINLAVSEMQQLLQQIDGRAWCYTWLCTHAVHAIVCWLAATICRPHGKFKQSLMYFTQAQQAVDEALRQQGIGQVSEAELPLQTVTNHHTLLYIKFLIIEGAALVHLTQVELVKAQKDIGVLLDLCRAHPRLLGKPMHSSLCMLAGHYAVASCNPGLAVEHFTTAARTSPSAGQAQLAAANAALTLLATEHHDNLTKAAQLMQQYGIMSNIDTALPYAERCGALFASAMVLGRQGQEQEGKLRLTKVLKLSHSMLGNHQMVSQVLKALAPAQIQRGDMTGAESMLQSSYTLSNGLHDLPTLLNTVQGIMQYYDRTGDMASYESNRKFADRKSKEYVLQIQEARQNPLHHTIMQCQGFG